MSPFDKNQKIEFNEILIGQSTNLIIEIGEEYNQTILTEFDEKKNALVQDKSSALISAILNHIDILLEMSNKKNEKNFIQKLELNLLLMTLVSIMAYPTDFLLISPYLLLSITDLIIIIQTKRV